MLSIKTKTTVSLLLVVVSVLGLYAINDYFQIKQDLYAELERSGNRQIKRLAKNLLIPLWEMDENWIDGIVTTEMEDKQISAIIVTGAEQLLVSKVRDEQWNVLDGPPKIEGDYLIKQKEVLQHDEKIGLITLYSTKQFVKNNIQEKLIILLIRTLILSFVIVVFFALTLQYLVINPLKNILLAVQALAKGDYDKGLIHKGNDEISLLVKGFINMRSQIKLRQTERDNAMLDLKQSQYELMKLNQSLEQHVQDRTAALEKSNHQLKKMSTAFEKSKNDAEAANRSKSVFLANMSHELRTPMNAVLGFSRLMQNDKGLSAEQKENLEIINRSGNNLLKLINDILDMAKIESGRVELCKEIFDLSTLIKDIIDLMHERAANKFLELTLDQSSLFPRVISSDSGKIRQILFNLLGNAIKCTDSGAISLRLHTQTGDTDNTISLVFEVEDSGRGISESDLPKIFNSFQQVGDQSVQNGSGLGLAITKQYIALMKGSISVTSEPGKGSVFKVVIPVERASEDAVLSLPNENSHKVISLKAGQADFRILIVEDQFENRLLLQRLLESVGFNVRVANDGLQGVNLFTQWKPDFIWMDRRMPVMDGIEATKKIRKLPGGDVVKIVAVTASVFEQERKRLVEAGVDEIVNKPFVDEDIFSCLAKQLNLQYVFEATVDENELTEDQNITNEDLAALPKALLSELTNAVTILDIEQSLFVIDKIKKIDSTLATQLKELVEKFDFQLINEKLTGEEGS